MPRVLPSLYASLILQSTRFFEILQAAAAPASVNTRQGPQLGWIMPSCSLHAARIVSMQYPTAAAGRLLASLRQQHGRLTAAGAVLGRVLLPVSATVLPGPLPRSIVCAVLDVVRGLAPCCQQAAVGWSVLLVCCLLLLSWPCSPQVLLVLLLQMEESCLQRLAAQYQPPLGPVRVALHTSCP